MRLAKAVMEKMAHARTEGIRWKRSAVFLQRNLYRLRNETQPTGLSILT